MTPTEAAAYEACARITRAQARNFSYGIRVLPAPKRSALNAVYALARLIDDIGDGAGPPGEKSAALDRLRGQLRTGEGDRAELVAVRHAATRFPIPLSAFEELLDGVDSDVHGRRYPTFVDLVGYCRCVAGSIGRLCLSVYGASDLPAATSYADSLGVALQQVNILRDLREDTQTGRCYLPEEDLQRFGVRLRLGADGNLADPDGRLRDLVRDAAWRARTWLVEGLRLEPLLDRRSRGSAMAMAGIYAAVLDRIEADPAQVLTRRVSLPTWQKVALTAAAVSGVAA